MSINRSMYIGLTGMNANTQAINIIGDNIANMNTIGFKSSRSVFQEMLGQSLMGAGGGHMGGGVSTVDVDKMFSQGALLGTGVAGDLAIAGDGFFAVQGEVGGNEGTFFTRGGQFHRDKDGFMVNPQGLKMMGYPAGKLGVSSSSLGPIQIDDAPMPPKSTDKLGVSVNINADAEDSELGDFNLQDNTGAAEFQTTVSVYDSLGRSHELTVFFDKSPDTNEWTYHVAMDKEGIDGTEGFTDPALATGPMTFNEDGTLNMGDATTEVKFTPNGLSEQTMTLDLTGTTNFAAKSSQVSQTQNGLQSGTFQNLNIDAEGKIMGTFSNGEQRMLGEVALARFKSTDGLSTIGGGMFAASIESGSVIMGKANAGGNGSLMSGALEQSTVDLATEFTNMIVAQRGYQANSKTITTADQMMQEAVNLKR